MPSMRSSQSRAGRSTDTMRQKFVTAFLVPTGIKASVGGYLGDATPFANLIASVSDLTLVNPNVVNGGVLNNISDTIV